MARLNVSVPDDLDRKFRKEIGRRYGMKKGNLQKAVAEAIALWIERGVSIKTETST